MLRLYAADDHVFALTDVVNADHHRHSFMQISVSLEGSFEIEVEGATFSCKGIIINSNVIHRFNGNKNKQIFLLIDCTSMLARSVETLIKKDAYYLFSDHLVNEMRSFITTSYTEIRNEESYVTFFSQFLGIFSINYIPSTITDERIASMINSLKACKASGHSIDTLAEQACLSSSRLSHLFKEQTGIALSSYLVLHKLQKAVFLSLSGVTITHAALEAGFDSPSHLAATSKKLLGISLSNLQKDSVFLKVSRYL